jgi:predicted peroxiredoxin
MTTILFNVTNASNDPTKATLPFIGAASALENGDQPQIALLGEGTYLALDHVRKSINGIGFPPLTDFFDEIVEHGVPVYV